jgi:class 3 adenylate cyclase/predicted ATPase
MQQIADWLEKLGMSEYAQRFAENRIDFSVLPDLTDQHLKDLQLPLGDRLKMLRAIRELSGATSLPSQPERRPQDAAERRQVTVMFSDLVGSTVLSGRMDPEDLREVISAYQKAVADTVQRFGGFVAKYMGDGVLVYFGYPQAHEDDAERTVRAGLDLVAAVSGLKTHAPLQTRVGIATGLVVVGDLIGSGASQEQAIVGETPNLAARLQGVAEPNSVVIAESTRKLVGNLFEVEDLGPKDLKGISGPVRAWAALRPSSVESRFEALHASGVTELVGRQEELELLLRRWSRAKRAEGQVVLLSGEPGIGKSRLTAALLESLATEPHARLRYFCSPQYTNSVLYPIIGQMERAAGLAHGDKLQARLDKLDAALAQTSTSIQDAALIAEMLSLANDGRYPTLDLGPQERRQKMLHALTSQLEALTRKSPVLMIFEDAHWIDPTSLEALGLIVDRIQALPGLLIVTFRPEFEAPWIGRPHVSDLTLNRLTQRDAVAIIDGITGSKPLPRSVRQDIIERTDGIPLFVEEMTKAVLEAGSEGAAQRTAAAVPSLAPAVPASLHASLMARLDRLGPAKEIAQVGAALGREFSHGLLVAVARKPAAEIGPTLDSLLQAGLLFRQGLPPHATYLFKHALVRDAAYGTLLRDARRDLHARVAHALDLYSPNVGEAQPELLAHHYAEAGESRAAATLWAKAGRRSHARSALAEAEVQLGRALAQIEKLPGTPALRRDQIGLQVELATVLMHIKGYGAEETKLAADKARTLIEKAKAVGEPPDDPLLLLSAIYGFWVVNIAGFNGDAAFEFAMQFLALAEEQGGSGPLMLAHRMVGMTLMSLGKPADGKAHLDQAITLYDPMEHRQLAARFGTDPQVAILEWRSRTLWLLGYPSSARQDVEQSFQIARDIGQAATLMHALAHSTISLILLGEYAEASGRARELIGLAEDKGSSYWSANGRMWEGCLAVLTGRPSDAVEILKVALRTYCSTGATIYTPFVLSNLARAHSELGQFGEALRIIHQAIAETNSTKEKWSEPEIYRILGEIMLRSPGMDRAAAQAHFDRAIVLAREQHAKAWELRASISLFCLLRDEGKSVEAREILGSIYGWFSQGWDTHDLKAAKAALLELA